MHWPRPLPRLPRSARWTRATVMTRRQAGLCRAGHELAVVSNKPGRCLCSGHTGLTQHICAAGPVDGPAIFRQVQACKVAVASQQCQVVDSSELDLGEPLLMCSGWSDLDLSVTVCNTLRTLSQSNPAFVGWLQPGRMQDLINSHQWEHCRLKSVLQGICCASLPQELTAAT